MHADKQCRYREDELGLLSSSGAALTVAKSCDSLSGESDIKRNCTSSQSLVIAALLAVNYKVRQHALSQDTAALTTGAPSLCTLEALWTEVMVRCCDARAVQAEIMWTDLFAEVSIKITVHLLHHVLRVPTQVMAVSHADSSSWCKSA